jgi:hypothetical protein
MWRREIWQLRIGVGLFLPWEFNVSSFVQSVRVVVKRLWIDLVWQWVEHARFRELRVVDEFAVYGQIGFEFVRVWVVPSRKSTLRLGLGEFWQYLVAPGFLATWELVK